MRSFKPHQCAVIDIGSNSVRLVVYDVIGLALTPRINEKVMAGLGRDMSRTGRLSEAGVELAKTALRRYRSILDALDIKTIFPIATAAVRDAADGDAFIQSVYDDTGFTIQLLSGADEARFAAQGVLAGRMKANCVVGDLGGSSLELIQIENGKLELGRTYPLGPLALNGNGKKFSASRVEAAIDDVFEADPLAEFQQKEFVAVGGGWRAFAKVDMTLRSYPIQVLHEYSMSVSDVISLCDQICQQNVEVMSVLTDVAGRRAETLPYGATVLKKVMQLGQFERLSISAYGLREGLVYSSLPTQIQQDDPLIAGVQSMSASEDATIEFGDELYHFLHDVMGCLPAVFDNAAREQRLWKAACHLADLGAALHPDHRAGIAYELTLRGPFAGEDHVGRTFLAHAIGSRYQKKFMPSDAVKHILSNEQIERARQLGVLLRLGAVFCARSAKIIKDGALFVDDSHLTLKVRPGKSSLISEIVERRLSQAASALGREPHILTDA